MKGRGVSAFLSVLGISLMLGLSTGCVTTSQTAQNGALVRARSAISKGEFDFALQRLAAAEGYVTPNVETTAEITYLRGLCYEGLNQPEEARALFKLAAEKYPTTVYGSQAKVKLGGSAR
jgi:hypothetical protein